MAGRIVMVHFPDEDAANAFIANTNIASQLGFSIMAMFIRPTKFCECPKRGPGRQPGRVHIDNWGKGKRTGLYLCRRCKRPSKHHEMGLFGRLQYVMGYNLLEERK